MKPFELWRDAKQTIEAQDDERLELARLRVLRATVIAAVVALAVVLVGMKLTPPAQRVIWAIVALALLWAVAGVTFWAIWRHRATTPELARASRTQVVLLSPLVCATCAFASWLLDHDVVTAVVTGASATGGLLLAACVQTWIARRG
jgi:hypothetical protein